jgi:hypothetical protein
VVGSLELFTRGKIFALGSDTLEVIRVGLEAIRDMRCALGHRRWRVPMFGLIRLGEPGYDGMGQDAGAGRFRQGLTVKTSSLENVFAGKGGN